MYGSFASASREYILARINYVKNAIKEAVKAGDEFTKAAMKVDLLVLQEALKLRPVPPERKAIAKAKAAETRKRNKEIAIKAAAAAAAAAKAAEEVVIDDDEEDDDDDDKDSDYVGKSSSNEEHGAEA